MQRCSSGFRICKASSISSAGVFISTLPSSHTPIDGGDGGGGGDDCDSDDGDDEDDNCANERDNIITTRR